MHENRKKVLEKGNKDTKWALVALTAAVLALTASGIQCNTPAPASEIQPIEEELESRVKLQPIMSGGMPSQDYKLIRDYRSSNYKP
jgi:hypothetical protein